VLGREFPYELIARAHPQRAEADLQAALGALTGAGLLFCRGAAPRSRYIFKHALIQEAAYQSLLRRTRQQYHRQVAELLEQQFVDVVEASPELVAHHYSEAGLPDPAIKYWQHAGERAARRSANQEAIGHLTTGLAQLAQLPETQGRARQELALQRLLGQASFAASGYASPEATRAFNRARELCAEIGDDGSIFPVLAGVFLFQMTGGHHANSIITANETIERAGRTDNTGARLVGNLLVGLSGFHLATLAHARAHFEKAIGYYCAIPVEKSARLAYEYGADPGAATYAYAAWCLWLLGYPDQALRLGDELLVILERIQHGFTHSRGLYWNSALHACRREWQIVEERSSAAIASAEERGLGMVVAVSRIMQGAARAMRDPHDEFVAEIREALAAYSATGARAQSTFHLILLAQALAECGRHDEGLSALREATALAEETGERFVDAEIHRLEGNLRLAECRDGGGAAGAFYVKALEVARAQQARSLELRAACDLARLWAEHGDRQRAADLLRPIYGWFTEGFDTPDLKEAKTLLEALNA
jgi:predicted ATPase